VVISVALSEGNTLRSSWKDVLATVSQVERLQLIANGISSSSIPDAITARITRLSADVRQARKSSNVNRSHIGGHFTPEVAEAIKAGELVVDMDKIFTQSSNLSGDAINSFVTALCEISWEEIHSSGESEAPRMFSLQKMVDVSYYNMHRIRVEWAQLWNIMGEQFNQVGCLENQRIVVFALDSLRQLAMRFFEIEELPHFKFQKDFLRPFEYIMINNPDQFTKEYVLQCIDRMILSQASRIKSGWSTIFAVFSAGASVPYGR
jgi:brefeldin A-inhibited guanine nucleotide-exchange protein